MQKQVLSGETEPQRHREQGSMYSGEVSSHLPCSRTLSGLLVGHLSPYSCFAGREM